MDSSREESPDWLRTFQAPTNSILTLSSGSDSSPNDSPAREDRIDEEELSRYDSSQLPEKDTNQGIVLDEKGAESPSNKISKVKSAKKCLKVTNISPQKKKTDNRKKRKADGADREDVEEVKSEEHIEPFATNKSIWTLSSDSESCPENSSLREDHIHRGESSQNKDSKFQERGKDKDGALFSCGGESPIKKASKEKSPKKKLTVEDHSPIKAKKIYHHEKRKENGDDVEVGEEEISEKHIEPHVSSSRLPLVLSEKVHRSKALVECEGESIDLSGDMGAVGRIVISDAPSGNHEMYLDLKGTIYKTTIVPSRTFCVVSFGQSEAKIEAIMNDFIQLKPQSNVYEAETMVEGTLDGFSFDSEDEGEKMPKAISHQTDQNEALEEQTNRKGKGKAEKASRVVRKKGKTAGGKSQPTKKVRKKTQVSKKSKPKK